MNSTQRLIQAKLDECIQLADELDQLLAEVANTEQCRTVDMDFDSVATVRVQITELAGAAGISLRTS